MSVLIKGMEMPKSCFYCPFRRKINPDDIQCLVTRDVFEETFAGTIEMRKRGFCPLIEVPLHGRLIDLDGTALAQYYDEEHEEWSMKTVTVEDILWGVCENMPPIVIPADKDGET